MSDIDSKILDWLCLGNFGASSMCMAMHLSGRKADGSYPHDSDDFSRCTKLLKVAPELRPLLHKMAAFNSYWAALIAVWDEIEALPDYKTQTAAIRKAIRPIEDKDRNVIRVGDGATIRFGKVNP